MVAKVKRGAWSKAARTARGLELGPPPGKGWMTRAQIAKAEGVSGRYASMIIADLRDAGQVEQVARLQESSNGYIHRVIWFRMKPGKASK